MLESDCYSIDVGYNSYITPKGNIMADQSNDSRPDDTDGISALDAVTDLVTGTSIPAPVRKNFF